MPPEYDAFGNPLDGTHSAQAQPEPELTARPEETTPGGRKEKRDRRRGRRQRRRAVSFVGATFLLLAAAGAAAFLLLDKGDTSASQPRYDIRYPGHLRGTLDPQSDGQFVEAHAPASLMRTDNLRSALAIADHVMSNPRETLLVTLTPRLLILYERVREPGSSATRAYRITGTGRADEIESELVPRRSPFDLRIVKPGKLERAVDELHRKRPDRKGVYATFDTELPTSATPGWTVRWDGQNVEVPTASR